MENKNNLPIVILSIAFALLLWSFVMGATNPEITREYRNVPVQLLNEEVLNDNQMIITEPKEPTVNVVLSGRRNDINRVRTNDIIATVDLASFASETQSMDVDVQAPMNTRFESASQNQIVFKFEKIISKEIPVVVETTGSLPSNNTIITNTKVNPERVSIHGPGNTVNSIQSANVILNLVEVEDDVTLNLPIILKNAEGIQVTGVNLSQSEVSLTVSVDSVKEVPIELKTEGESPEGLRVSSLNLNQETVSITGDQQVLEGIDKVETKPIALADITESANITVDLSLPENVFLADPEKAIVVHAVVESGTTKTFNIRPNALIYRNTPEGLTASTSLEEPISVTIRGGSSYVDALTGVNAYVNLEGLSPGTYDLPIGVDEVDNISLEKVEPANVEVILE